MGLAFLIPSTLAFIWDAAEAATGLPSSFALSWDVAEAALGDDIKEAFGAFLSEIASGGANTGLEEAALV